MSKTDELEGTNPAPSPDLSDNELEAVAGGVRKAGGNQQDYFKVTLEDVLISGVQSGGDGK